MERAQQLVALLLSFSVFGAIADSGCNDDLWSQVKQQYQTCVHTTQKQLDSYKNADFDPAVCGLMEKMIDCSELLSPCMEAHMGEAQTLLFSMPVEVNEWSEMMAKCQVQHRFKRSPGKATQTATRIVSHVAASSKGSALLKSVLNKPGTKGGAPKLSGVASLASPASAASKKSVLRRVGKYAVVGLAAYGTYKFAKSLSKGVRRDYDDDECWRFSILQDRYECICSAQCNIYAGSASSLNIAQGLLAVTSLFAIFLNRRYL